MAVTEVGIANSALVKVGGDVIQSLTQDIKQARLINTIFPFHRDNVLRAHPWNFAVRRVTINPNGVVPDSEFDFTYDIPADCLRVLNTPDNASIQWVVEENRTLLTNESTLKIRYIFRNTDPTTWDSCFAEAFAWRLASEIAFNLSDNESLSEKCLKRYKEVLAEARSMDGAEGKIPGLIADTWTKRRL